MATEAQIKAWLVDPKAGSLVYKRNWNQYCQALMYQLCKRFGMAPVVYPTANAARAASKIVGTDPAKAPAGAFHYWTIGSAGHVAYGLGGTRVLMGSKHVVTKWATNVGVTTVAAYSKASGAKYVGWALTNGKNDAAFTVPPVVKPPVVVPPVQPDLTAIKARLQVIAGELAGVIATLSKL
jgi:hypothetical protein